ncbi:hypothetical protein GGE35_000161 [Rhizobium cellulosilyticum]|uniref:Uncharacterized protein n=1 Tax=Aliirhizobium cellulosilyticum TaxID=393664 RepID=A0A7W6UVI9_9HYPH|nr:hypothetical protein [Rhizobium cellulosilyticum]MBB4409692.1 hypothetical protein [Rhizobium cellulosilyticum]MBB4444379.1 hypothetical protein [Rhizobium cellulosilyticum]
MMRYDWNIGGYVFLVFMAAAVVLAGYNAVMAVVRFVAAL